MQTLRTAEDMRAWADARRSDGLTIGLVPTMGSLHEGHVSLMKILRPHVDRMVCSIFVNPLQFAPGEDREAYPCDEEGDAWRCLAAGVDALFVPVSMYPPGFDTRVLVGRVARRWEGAARPTHFEGVATVVSRLFGITQCHRAAFGEKDYQQLAVIRRVVTDLSLAVQIVACPLIRDTDGVALSSRNVYLTATQRGRARTLSQALFEMQREVSSGVCDVATLEQRAVQRVDCDRLEYLAIVDSNSLEPVGTVDRPCRVLAVAHYGSTRLLDNVEVG